MSAPTVVIMAAGQGTRMRSKTPKMLHEVCGRCLIGWVIAAARDAQAGAIVVVVGPDHTVEPALPDDITVVVQETALGTADAVLTAADVWGDETVVVLSGDTPLITGDVIRDLIDAHERAGAAGTLLTMQLDDAGSLGRVVRGADGAFERVVETKGGADAEISAITEANAGVYAFDGAVLEDALRRVVPDAGSGEAYLPEVLALLREDGHAVADEAVADATLVLGVNDRVDLARVRAHAQVRINHEHMRAGVTIIDPASTYVEVGVTIGPDTTIEPNTTLKGDTRVGADCVLRNAYVDSAVIEDGVSVGPFAYLRPGTVLRSGAKAGTFVEIKNSDIGPGAKVPHLSYIGDADIGANSNLGAATVTANYDGVRKHRTTIGKNVRTGVDTTLVAPVTIGDGAYTGANSAIHEDVPEGALAIARPRQTVVEGYAARVVEERR